MPKNKTVLTAEPMHKFVLTAEATQQFKEIIDDYARQTTWKRYFSELPKKVTDVRIILFICEMRTHHLMLTLFRAITAGSSSLWTWRKFAASFRGGSTRTLSTSSTMCGR